MCIYVNLADSRRPVCPDHSHTDEKTSTAQNNTTCLCILVHSVIEYIVFFSYFFTRVCQVVSMNTQKNE